MSTARTTGGSQEHARTPLNIDALKIDTLRVDGTPSPTLTVGGTIASSPTQFRRALGLLTAQLVSARQVIPGAFSAVGERWEATFPLLLARWGSAALPLPSGGYRVEFSSSEKSRALEVVAAAVNRQLVGGLFGVEFDIVVDSLGSHQLTVLITPPLTADELGADNQRRLEATYRATKKSPHDGVFFESFYGQLAACNPLGIDRALRELLPSMPRYWSVVDYSVETPEGAIAIVEGSSLWWQIRGSARLLVVNDWLRKRYKKRSGQKVLQTWHGTPLKKIALSRNRTEIRAAIATLRESARWDILLAQNPHSARVIRGAYGYSGPIWHEGYPRNDILISEDSHRVRKRLGIADGLTVLLYAPTWRDDRPGHVDHLEVEQFAQNLGEGYLTLIRGHSRSLGPGKQVLGNGVLDVTSYPDVSELFLVADALITDYSSVMFDFSVTGKPLFFFAPDLTHYREKLRGFYFDLASGTPGPLVSTAQELIELIRNRHGVPARYSTAYAAWQSRFNPRDDGDAGRRVVERLIREKLLG